MSGFLYAEFDRGFIQETEIKDLEISRRISQTNVGLFIRLVDGGFETYFHICCTLNRRFLVTVLHGTVKEAVLKILDRFQFVRFVVLNTDTATLEMVKTIAGSSQAPFSHPKGSEADTGFVLIELKTA